MTLLLDTSLRVTNSILRILARLSSVLSTTVFTFLQLLTVSQKYNFLQYETIKRENQHVKDIIVSHAVF